MKLSRILTGLLSVALLAFMVSDTLGQDEGRRGGDRGGRGGGPGGGPGGFQGRGGGGPGFGRGGGGGDLTMGLLRIDAVKVELEVSPDQEEALTKLQEQGQGGESRGRGDQEGRGRGDQEGRGDQGRGQRPNFADLSDAEREELIAQRQKEQEARQKEQEARVAKMKEQLEEILFPEQIERLDQISLQLRGLRALDAPEVSAKLKISEDQKKKLAEVQGGMREKMMEVFRSAGGDRDAMTKAFTEAREKNEQEVLAVLTSNQKKEFEEMKGKPFKMPEGVFGRGGFGGGPGGGGFGGRGGRGGTGGGDGGRGRGGDRGRPSRPQTEE